jgi:hypothetical protein
MAAPKAHVFWLRLFSPGLCGGEWPGKKSVVGFIRFFFNLLHLDYGRQERSNSATLIFRTAGVATMRQVRSRILEGVKSFFRDKEGAKTPKKWKRPKVGLGIGFCRCAS